MTFLDQRLAGTRSSPYMMKINHSLQCPMLPSSAILKAQKKKKSSWPQPWQQGLKKLPFSCSVFCFWFPGLKVLYCRHGVHCVSQDSNYCYCFSCLVHDQQLPHCLLMYIQIQIQDILNSAFHIVYFFLLPLGCLKQKNVSFINNMTSVAFFSILYHICNQNHFEGLILQIFNKHLYIFNESY